MNILKGDETPEQLMIYLKNFEDKILENTVSTAPEKLAILRQIVDMEAQTIVSGVEADFEGYSEAEDLDEKMTIRSVKTSRLYVLLAMFSERTLPPTAMQQ